MKTSRYAPKTPGEALAQSRAEKLKQEKERATRLLGRLGWKAELLMVSYFKALEIQNAAAHHSAPAASSHAESMFKVDFFEFYTLLERYITVCLSVLGVSISASVPRNVNALRYITNPDLHRTRPLASHAFHANLLEALDDENCPLHASLGVQDVRIQLGLAKDYRNAWKDAGEKTGAKWDGEETEARRNVSLVDLELEYMLRLLVVGCEHANDVVQAFEGKSNAGGFDSSDFEPREFEGMSGGWDDAPDEFMHDAMEID
jgi:hypothetical protein